MPAWTTPELWPVWWVAISASRSSTQTLGAGLAAGQLAGDGEAEDAPADDRDVASLGHELRSDTLLRCRRSRS